MGWDRSQLLPLALVVGLVAAALAVDGQAAAVASEPSKDEGDYKVSPDKYKSKHDGYYPWIDTHEGERGPVGPPGPPGPPGPQGCVAPIESNVDESSFLQSPLVPGDGLVLRDYYYDCPVAAPISVGGRCDVLCQDYYYYGPDIPPVLIDRNKAAEASWAVTKSAILTGGLPADDATNPGASCSFTQWASIPNPPDGEILGPKVTRCKLSATAYCCVGADGPAAARSRSSPRLPAGKAKPGKVKRALPDGTVVEVPARIRTRSIARKGAEKPAAKTPAAKAPAAKTPAKKGNTVQAPQKTNNGKN